MKKINIYNFCSLFYDNFLQNQSVSGNEILIILYCIGIRQNKLDPDKQLSRYCTVVLGKAILLA